MICQACSCDSISLPPAPFKADEAPKSATNPRDSHADEQHGHVSIYLREHNIKAAIERGCWVCSLVWKAVESLGFRCHIPGKDSTKQGDPGEILRVTMVHASNDKVPWLEDNSGLVLKLLDQRKIDEEPESVDFLEDQYVLFGRIPWPPRMESSMRTGLDLCSNTGDPNRLDAARRWLHDCETRHVICKPAPFCPERILHVYTENGQMAVRLCRTTGEPLRYACLSYCWGAGGQLTTTKATEKDRLRGIDLARVPKTIRDAMTVCWTLGIDFIWVDALCIVQDDVGDWNRQCRVMAEIYSGACLTVAAARASRADEGLFSSGEFHGRTFITRTPLGDSTEVRIRPRLDHVSRADYGKAGVQSRPLFSRAWVFQEMLLSPRLLRFEPGELAWECLDSTVCECRNTAVKPDRLAGDGKRPLLHVMRADLVALRSGTLPDGDFFALWKTIVALYSALQISFRKDRLPALSAVASVFAGAGARYCAGNWEHHLLPSLAWVRNLSNEPLARPEEATAEPSWSWSSYPDEVAFMDLASTRIVRVPLTATILDVQCPAAVAANELGSVSPGGFLSVSGLLQPVRIRAYKGVYKFAYEMSVDGTRYVRTGVFDAGIWLWIDYELPGVDAGHPGDFHCFLLWRNTAAKPLEISTFAILLRLVDKTRNVYQRIGGLRQRANGLDVFEGQRAAKTIRIE